MDRIRVLLIDDEEELVSTLVERLEIRQIEAEYVMSGVQGLKKLEESKFDAVLLDYMLPGMSGLEVMKRIKEKYPEIKVLVMTGRGAVGGSEESKLVDTSDLLLKPVNIEVLIDKLKKAVQR